MKERINVLIAYTNTPPQSERYFKVLKPNSIAHLLCFTVDNGFVKTSAVISSVR